MNEAELEARADHLLTLAQRGHGSNLALVNEVYAGSLAILYALYGQDSEQMRSVRAIANRTFITNPGNQYHCELMLASLVGVLTNVKGELAAGFVGNLRKQIVGDVLTDFIQLSRTALQESDNNAKNVAAVLAAAAYEDTIRRMGVSFAGIVERDDLNKVIDALKNTGILVAPQLGIAISYLSFRNHALHAEWEKIDRAAVHSVLGFVDQLLLKHFA